MAADPRGVKISVAGANNGYDDSGTHNGAGTASYKVPLQGSPSAAAAAKAKAALDVSNMPEQEVEFQPEQFTNDEWDEIRRQFSDFDLDGNGYIEIEEFIGLCTQVGLSRERAEKLSMMYDEDGDGVIDFSEFAKRDVVGDLQQAVEDSKPKLEAQEPEEIRAGLGENTSHVNVAKILQVVRAKIDNSKIAFAFGRYMLYVCIYIYVVMYQRNPQDSLRISTSLRNYFVGSEYLAPNGMETKSLMDIVTVEDVWDWTQINFVGGLFYNDKYYNDAFRTRVDRNSVLEHNKLTGGFRLTQRRIRNDTCLEGRASFKRFAPNCYGELYVEAMVPFNLVEKEPFYGPFSGKTYNWERKWFWDVGYYQEFTKDKEDAVARLHELRMDNWIGPATQWIRLDFALYNPNVGSYAFCVASFEVRPTGLIIPNFEVTVRRSGYYIATQDYIRLAMEVVVVAGWAAYTWGEFLDARRLYKQSGKMLAYFSEFWNAVDLLHLVIMLMLFFTWVYIVSDSTISELIITEDQITMANGAPLDFTETALAIRFYYATHGFNLLICVVRILKFLRQNAFLGQLTDAFELMRPGLLQFAVVLFISIFMFTAMGVILFGSKIQEFTAFLEAVDNIMGYTIGYSDPMDLFGADSVGAIVFYYPFTFLMAFFVLPLTVAVIMDGYGEMQAMYEAARSTNLADVINLDYPDQLYRGFIRSMQFFIPHHHRHPRLRLPAKEEVLRLFADLNKIEIISYAELRKMFRDKFISEELLVEVIKKYNAFRPDPQWDLPAAAEGNPDGDHLELAPLIEQLQLRADQLVRDQQSMQRKLDLLCEIFPPPPPAESIEMLSKSGGKF